jgi:hypothetical protein
MRDKEETIESWRVVESPEVLVCARSKHGAVLSQVNAALPEFVAYAPGHTVLKTIAVARDIHDQDCRTAWSFFYGQLGHGALLKITRLPL